jgi:hypothetical protein
LQNLNFRIPLCQLTEHRCVVGEHRGRLRKGEGRNEKKEDEKERKKERKRKKRKKGKLYLLTQSVILRNPTSRYTRILS